MTPREAAQRAIDLGANGVTVEHFTGDVTLDLNTTDRALLSSSLDGRPLWLTVDKPVEPEHIVLAHQRMRISCDTAVRRLSELGYHVRNADHLPKQPAEQDAVLLRGLDSSEIVPPGHILAVSRRLVRPVQEVVERLAVYGLRARSIPEPVLDHDVKILCRDADGDEPWLKPTARVRRHHVVKASAILGLACADIAARLREYGFDVSPIENLPARAGESELALLRRELNGEGSWIDTDKPVPAGHLVALSHHYGWTVREAADRMANYELTIPAELPDRPEVGDLMLLSEGFDEEPPWLTTEDPIAPGHILDAAQRHGRTAEEIADRLRAYGFDPPPTSTLPDRPTLIDLKLLSRYLDGTHPWLTRAEPVTLTFLIRAARKLRLDILEVVTRLTNARLDVPDPTELVRTALARVPRVAPPLWTVGEGANGQEDV
ncbi:hypothetical protein [Actinocrispum wychmicini]|nr:hypothetical protein [Actinocrispum wychmicini]